MHEAVGAPDAGLTLTAWAREALALLTDVAGVHRVGLALTEGGGRRLRFVASDRGNDLEVAWCHVDAYDDVPLNTAVRTGEPVLGALDELHERYAAFVARQRRTRTRALAAIPVVTSGRVAGGYVLFFDQPQPFDSTQREELTRAAESLGAGLQRVQRGHERPESAEPDEPVPAGAVVATHEVPPDPAAVARARRFIRHALRDWGVDDDTTYTAELCLSELVTNAVVHAHAGCVVHVLLDQGLVRTTVRDGGAADAASVEPLEDPLRVYGRGLELVDALATRWGSRAEASGTTVWFVLEP